MSSFGKRHLEKYGWTQGKGLGKCEHGLTEPLKPKLKFDAAGLGHNRADEFTFHWWDHVYNKTAKNINVVKKENGLVELNMDKECKPTTKRPSKYSHQTGNGLNDYFIKGDVLTGSNTSCKVESDKDSDTDSEEDSKDYSTYLSTDQLFQICGGLTAHKGARHGITMTAKLARLQNQEKAFCSPTSSPNCADTMKPILRDSTPGSAQSSRRKSVQFSEVAKMKIFFYCNNTEERDVTIKMDGGVSLQSAFADYTNEQLGVNSVVEDVSVIKNEKKRLKKNKSCVSDIQDLIDLTDDFIDLTADESSDQNIPMKDSDQTDVSNVAGTKKKKKKHRKQEIEETLDREKENQEELIYKCNLTNEDSALVNEVSVKSKKKKKNTYTTNNETEQIYSIDFNILEFQGNDGQHETTADVNDTGKSYNLHNNNFKKKKRDREKGNKIYSTDSVIKLSCDTNLFYETIADDNSAVQINLNSTNTAHNTDSSVTCNFDEEYVGITDRDQTKRKKKHILSQSNIAVEEVTGCKCDEVPVTTHKKKKKHKLCNQFDREGGICNEAVAIGNNVIDMQSRKEKRKRKLDLSNNNNDNNLDIDNISEAASYLPKKKKKKHENS